MAMDVSKLVDKAKECVEKRNYGYAIELYQQALTLSPNDVEARKALRAVAVRNVKENGVSKVSAILKGLVPMLKLILPSKDPERRMMAAEQYLKNDPGSAKVLRKLGMAALKAGHTETAVWVFEDLYHNHSKDAEAARTLAQAYEAVGMIGESLDTYKILEKIKPGDREAQVKIRDLSASGLAQSIQTATEGAADGKASRKVLKSDEETEKLKLLDGGGRTPEEIRKVAEYVAEDAEKRPKDPNLRIKLGDTWMRIQEWDQALAAYKQAQEISPTEYRIKMKLQDLEMAKMLVPIRQLREKIKGGADGEAKKQLQGTESKYYNYRLKCFMEREGNYITDLNIAFELGNLYFRFRNFDEAAKRFQKTQNDPSKRAQSLLRLGVCFKSMGQNNLSEEAFTGGINSIEVNISQSDIKKDLTYERAVLYEALERPEDAKKDYQAIYAVDIGYKDVGAKLKELG